MPEAVSAHPPTVTNNRRRVMSWSKIKRHPLGLLGVAIAVIYVVTALMAQNIAPYSPNEAHLAARVLPPAWLSGGNPDFLLGTDYLGRDLLSRLIHGTRIALLVGIGGVTIACIIGILAGLFAGMVGGWRDSLIMRVLDTFIAIPNILLYLTILGVFGPSLTGLIIVIGLVNWTSTARVVRAEVLSLKRREFVEASTANGQRLWITAWKHVLPNTLPSIIVLATLDVAAIIILESALSFLGLGVQAPAVTWGRMLADGREYLASAWWLAAFPGIVITILSLSLILIGDMLRDLLDPRTY